MVKQLKIEFPGAVYHITWRGNKRRKIKRLFWRYWLQL